MTVKKNGRSFLRKFINFITFVDLPIKKKFLLFAVGVLFWFLTMFIMSIATIIDMNNKSSMIVNSVMPHDRVTQKITRKLQSLTNDSHELSKTSDISVLNKKIYLSKEKIADIRSFVSALMNGGNINDVQRDLDKFIESFTVESIKGYPEGEKYVDDITPLLDTLSKEIAEIEELKRNVINKNIKDPAMLDKKIEDYQSVISSANLLSVEFSASVAKLYELNAKKIWNATLCTSVTSIIVLLISISLLLLFTVWISKSIANPVKSIIDQIRALGEGEVDLTKRLEITSKDEIGVLSNDFNELMEEIHGMSAFKKVIEEDESIEDVYARLGNVFSEKLGLYDYMIYQVSNSQNKMNPAYPLVLNNKDLFCNEEILYDADLCRAKKTGHSISSVSYPRICKQFRTDVDKVHICIPMIVGGSTGGVVQFLFENKMIDRDKKDSRLFKAEQFMKESLAVLEAKRLMNTLKESALKDALTGLYNRRFLQEYTETLVAGVQRRGKVVGLVMCDLDYFKQVNDVYGHNVGDAVLKETSVIIKKNVRDSDLVIRFGGEEFLVLLMDIKEGDAMNVAEKIRANVQEAKIKVPDGTLKKTISMGISEFPADTDAFWQAIKFADVALYKAKETGRNRSVRFMPEMWKEEQF